MTNLSLPNLFPLLLCLPVHVCTHMFVYGLNLKSRLPMVMLKDLEIPSPKRKVSNYSPFFMVKCFCIWENVLCFHWERQELKFKVCKSAWWAGWAYGGSLETFHWHAVSFSSLLPLSHWAVSPKLECRALLVLPVCERCWLGGIWFEVPLAFKSWIWRHEQLIG